MSHQVQPRIRILERLEEASPHRPLFKPIWLVQLQQLPLHPFKPNLPFQLLILQFP